MIIKQLPDSIREMAEIIGLNNALAVVSLCGGNSLYIPKTVNKKHWLIQVVGLEAMQTLCNYYQGDTLELPRCSNAIQWITRQSIIRDSDTMTAPGLARKYGYTERGIRKVLNGK